MLSILVIHVLNVIDSAEHSERGQKKRITDVRGQAIHAYVADLRLQGQNESKKSTAFIVVNAVESTVDRALNISTDDKSGVCWCICTSWSQFQRQV